MQKLIFKERIYTYQIDFVGHVSNIVYIQWLENGRTRMLEKMGYPVDKLATNNIMPILTETNIRYKTPLYINNTVRIEMWISRLNNASAVMEFRIYNETGQLCASAQQKGLFIDRQAKRPARISESQRKEFEKFLSEDNPAR